MMQIWRSIFELAAEAVGPKEGRRVSNYALAVTFSSDQAPTGPELGQRSRELALTINRTLKAPAKLFTAISRLLAATDTLPLNAQAVDGWIEAFQSADATRKNLGAYATPASFADKLAEETLAPLLSAGKSITVVDPAVGAGSLLLATHRALIARGWPCLESIYCLHGAELDPAARELCVLLLWLSAGGSECDIRRIAENIVEANSLTYDWWSGKKQFDALIMNPPWESLRHRSSDEVNSQTRTETIARLDSSLCGAKGLPPLYTAQGRGDKNLFKAFVELAPHLIRSGGRIGALLPAAFGSDDGMSALRHLYLEQLQLESWTSFENRAKHFSIDSRYKFGLLIGTRSPKGTNALRVRSFCVQPEEVDLPHILLSRDDVERIGGKDRMIPELVSEKERDILGQMLASNKSFFAGGPLGTVKYRREVDLTLGKRDGMFWHVSEPAKVFSKDAGMLPFENKRSFVPVLEGRMIGQYDCFQKSWVSGEGRSAKWEYNGDRPLSDGKPQFVTLPRISKSARVAICDITSATNTRTVLASLVPSGWVCGNTAPVLLFDNDVSSFAGLAILNSMVFDWFARRMVGGLHLNKFYLARMTWPNFRKGDVARLAELARIVAENNPRSGISRRLAMQPVDKGLLVSAMAEIEAIVASGYSLNANMLSEVLSPDRSDRRGMWRYFESSPLGQDVAAEAIVRLRGMPLRKSMIAA